MAGTSQTRDSLSKTEGGGFWVFLELLGKRFRSRYVWKVTFPAGPQCSEAADD